MFNRKLKARINELERKLRDVTDVLKIIIKCTKCGEKAEFIICRKLKEDVEGSHVVENLLCTKCIEKSKIPH